MWVTTSEFAGKDNNEIVSCRYSFVYFPREVLDIVYEDLLYGFYSLPFKFSGRTSSGDFDITIFLIYIIHAY